MRICIIGFGTVGRGVTEHIHRKNLDIKVVAICERDCSVYDKNGIDLGHLIEHTKGKPLVEYPKADRNLDTNKIIESKCADIYVELTPTNIKNAEPGYSFIKKILSGGHHVVTSDKGPLVLHYRELKDLAEKNNVKFFYEATVGGAMPVLNMARDNLRGNTILSVRGILNGTTNYILTRMGAEGAPFDQILKEAQELGIAEKDPSYDVEGIDAAAKAVILANEFFSRDVSIKDVDTTGITKITPEFVSLAEKNGYKVKLIVEVSDRILKVAPRLIEKNHPLAVDGTLNALNFTLDMANEITVVGYGAGKYETAGAVISDIMSIKG
ncbi:MAG: homoserine dehydrogenase [archaeon]